MSKLHVRHIASKLQELYKDKIDITDGYNEEEKKTLFLTRSFAAYSLQILAGVSVETAAMAVVDGRDDNAIDAIYFDKKEKILWLVQSKWIKSGQGEPETGDTSKFKTGVADLIDFELSRFNTKVQAKQQDIDEALNDYEVKINIVLAYTGADSFSTHNQRIVDDMLDLINDSSEIASFERFTLSQAHRSLSGIIEGQPIKAEIAIENWGKVEIPYKAIYGAVNGSSFAQLWSQYRSRLFSENIRDFLGKSSVNDDIKSTITNEPDNFFYYNNGVTILCQNFIKKPVMLGRDTGQFEINDLKIVNGAQTVGSIGSVYEQNPEAVESISVFVKIISLENCESNFANNVTQKTNTQNKIEKRDFVSLDPQQERLQTELALDGITYQIKRTSDILSGEKQCNVEELMIAVACSLSNVNYTVLAKREVGKLWENIGSAPYIDIVNDRLTAVKAWRCIEIMNRLSSYIKEKSKSISGRERMCLIHSNRFALHLILNQINPQILLDPNYDFNTFCTNDLLPLIESTEEKIFSIVEERYSQSLVHQVFRNYTKCRDIKDKATGSVNH